MPIGMLASGLISVLTPLVKKGAEALANTVGKAAVNKADEILHKLKERWETGDKDPVAADTLKRFEQNPERYQPMLEDVLKEKLEADPQFAKQLQGLLDEIGVEVIQKFGEVSGEVTGVEAKELNRGRVKVEQSADKVSGKITGARIDRIG